MAVVEGLEETSRFSDVTQGLYEYLQSSYHLAFAENLPPNKLDSWNISTYDITCVAVMTVILLALRFILTKRVFMPIAEHYDIPEESRKKIPESAWGFIFDTCSWSYTWYVVVLSGKYQFFQKPETVWHGWSLETFPPGDIYTIYVIYSGHYLQFIYATLFLDTRRKDFYAMVLHHILCLISMYMTHASRCHNLGVLTLFLMLMSMAFFEFYKLCSYFEMQGLKFHKWIRGIRCTVFVCFVVVWFISRFYWYPLKVIYQAVHIRRLKLNIPHLFSLGLQSYGFVILNIYWSVFILKIVYKSATGQKHEDPRESVDAEKYFEELSFDDNCSDSILEGNNSENFRRLKIENSISHETPSCFFSKYDFSKNMITEKKFD